jgi:diacylglycerol kinase family enzyme
MTTNDKPIPIIMNPASGKPKPVLHTISETFRAHNLSWYGHFTYEFGDAIRFAKEAEPPQPVWLDGEFYRNTPVTIQVHRQAVKIVVPSW